MQYCPATEMTKLGSTECFAAVQFGHMASGLFQQLPQRLTTTSISS